MIPRRALFAVPLLALPAPCPRTRVAELPLRLVDGFPIVDASLAGQPVSLILDTGAQGLLVTPEAVRALGLPLNGMQRIYGTGGSREVPVVALPGLRLGGAPMPGLFAPVSTLPLDLQTIPPLAGLLGATLLARFDLELDVANGRAALWTREDCPPPFEGTTIALEISRAGEAFAPVRVNGEPLLALLDTGSRTTILNTATARRLNLQAPPSANTAPGIDGARLPVEHVEARLALGSERPRAATISIAPLQLERGDMLLGLDQLGPRHLWLSYAAGTVTLSALKGGGPEPGGLKPEPGPRPDRPPTAAPRPPPSRPAPRPPPPPGPPPG